MATRVPLPSHYNTALALAEAGASLNPIDGIWIGFRSRAAL